MIPKGYQSASPETMPEPEAVDKMMAYNRALRDAGVLVALEGLRPPSTGARVSFENGRARVTPGPFEGVSEVVGGFWVIEVGSLQAAIDWASQCPAAENEVIEVRQVQEFKDFPPEIQKAIGKDWDNFTAGK